MTSPSATVSITVTPVNDAPAATAQSVSTAEDTAKVVTVAGTDVDGDDAHLRDRRAARPRHAEPRRRPGDVHAGGELQRPGLVHLHRQRRDDDSAHGDGLDHGDRGERRAGRDGAERHDGRGHARRSSRWSAATSKVSALTYAIASQPGHGSVALDDAQATYTPAANYYGPDSFTFTASDGTTTSAPATVSVTVTSVNDAPTVTATRLQTTAGTPVSRTLATSDPDGDTVTISAATRPVLGSVTFSGTTVTYTPAARSGTDTFLVRVSDGHGGTAQAQVVVEISALTAQLHLTTPSPTRGTPVETTITTTSPSGAIPEGSVTLTNGATTLGTVALRPDGTASVPWTPALAGVTNLVASYAGDARFAPTSSPPAPVTVAKTTAQLKVSGSLKSGRPGVVKVKVSTVAGLPATGRMTLKVGSSHVHRQAQEGCREARIPRCPSSSKLKVKASYSGDGQYAGGSAKHTFQLRT